LSNQIPPIVTEEDQRIVSNMQQAVQNLLMAASQWSQASAEYDAWIAEKQQSRIVLA
jgi:hypothetical protein